MLTEIKKYYSSKEPIKLFFISTSFKQIHNPEEKPSKILKISANIIESHQADLTNLVVALFQITQKQ